MMPEIADRSRVAAQHDIIHAPSSPTRPARSRIGLLIAIVLIVGGMGRVAVFARNPSLWIDEAMLAWNVMHRSPLELTQPLDMNQGAPLGFLWASKAVVAMAGSSELALRFLPMVASLVGLMVFPMLAYRALPLMAARFAVLLFAVSPYLIGYAAEFKQYELDATLAVTLLLLAQPCWEGTASARRGVLLAIVGAGAVWCSHPAVFVLGGIGLAMLATILQPGLRTGSRRQTLWVIGAWFTSFVLCYLLFLRKLGANDYLLEYWSGKFLPLPPIRPGDWAWLVDHGFALFAKPGGFGQFGLAGLAGTCALIGACSLAQTHRSLLLAWLTPLALALLASGLRKYPFAGRLMLFCVPILLLLVAQGLSVLFEQLQGVGVARWLVVAVAFVGPIAECNELWKRPLHAEDVRETVAQLSQEFQPGDQIYVYRAAAPTLRYYATRFGLPLDVMTFGQEARGPAIDRVRQELLPLRGCPRVWVLLAHFQSTDEAAIVTHLDDIGTGRTVSRRRDARLLLYALR